MKDFLGHVRMLVDGSYCCCRTRGGELHDGEVVNKTLLKICNITRPSVARNIQINLFSSPENSLYFSPLEHEGGMCADLLLVG